MSFVQQTTPNVSVIIPKAGEKEPLVDTRLKDFVEALNKTKHASGALAIMALGTMLIIAGNSCLINLQSCISNGGDYDSCDGDGLTTGAMFTTIIGSTIAGIGGAFDVQYRAKQIYYSLISPRQ
jgi:hypothetical protein